MHIWQMCILQYVFVFIFNAKMKILVILFVVLICSFTNYLSINASSSCSNKRIEVILLLYKCTKCVTICFVSKLIRVFVWVQIFCKIVKNNKNFYWVLCLFFFGGICFCQISENILIYIFAIFFHSNFGSKAIFITIWAPHCYALLVIINFFFPCVLIRFPIINHCLTRCQI
jgi:hypothetical protein